MEIRTSFTIADHGSLPENGERFLDAFTRVFAEGGPSVSQDTRSGRLTITFGLEADDAQAALERASRIFAAGIRATGLPATEVLDVEASAVAAGEPGTPPLLQTA